MGLAAGHILGAHSGIPPALENQSSLYPGDDIPAMHGDFEEVLQSQLDETGSNAEVVWDSKSNTVVKTYQPGGFHSEDADWDLIMTVAASKVSKEHGGFLVPEYSSVSESPDGGMQIITKYAGPTVNEAAKTITKQAGEQIKRNPDFVSDFIESIRIDLASSISAFMDADLINGDLALRDVFVNEANHVVIGDWGSYMSSGPLENIFGAEKGRKYTEARPVDYISGTREPKDTSKISQQSDEDHLKLWCNGYDLTSVDWKFYAENNDKMSSFPTPAENFVGLRMLADGTLKGLLVPNAAMIEEAGDHFKWPYATWGYGGRSLTPAEASLVEGQNLNSQKYDLLPLEECEELFYAILLGETHYRDLGRSPWLFAASVYSALLRRGDEPLAPGWI